MYKCDSKYTYNVLLIVVIINQEFLDLPLHPLPIHELCLRPHGQRNRGSALGGRNALATPTRQGPLAGVTKQRDERIRRRILRLLC